MAGVKGRSGGKRANQTGRPPKEPIDYDTSFKQGVLNAVAELEEENNMPFLKKVFSMVYSDDIQDTVKASLFKTYSEIFATKKTETKLEDLTKEPKIYLPAQDKDE